MAHRLHQHDGACDASNDRHSTGTSTPHQVQTLRISSYNTTGFGKAKQAKVQCICENSDIMLIQEHWKLPSQLQSVKTCVKGFMGTAVSAVDATARILPGRPYGGCAILWRKSLDSVIQPVDYSFMCNRVCGITVKLNSLIVLILCVYFPTDPGTAEYDSSELDVLLSDIHSICDHVNPDGILIGGDINCDFSRNSGFVNDVAGFLASGDLHSVWDHNPIDYTYMHTDKESTSTIDHFLLNNVLQDLCISSGVNHCFSDGIFHSPIFVHLNVDKIPVEPTREETFTPRLAWYKASQNDIELYKHKMGHALSDIHVPDCVNNCSDNRCQNESHKRDIETYYDVLVNVMISASDHIPRTCKPEDNTRVPGWTVHVKPFKDESLFWKAIYDQQKPNASEYVTHMMRSSRNAYHYAVRRAKRHRKMLQRSNFMNSMMQGDRQFIQEIRKIKKHNKTVPSAVDGLSEPQEIADHFASKYSTLYNSAVYDDHVFKLMSESIDDNIDDSQDVFYAPHDIGKAISCLKNSKQDGMYDLMSDNFVHAPVCFYSHVADFFNACIRHGFMPNRMLVSTMIPIPKGSKNESLSENYRAIALCVLFLKIFEYCLLNGNRDKLLVSGLQFAYKPEHSTSQCTWLAKEVISHYKNRGSDVYACLLDCSKAFDKVKHDVLFKMLCDKGLSPLIIRIIMKMYLSGSAQVRWDGCTSTMFNVTNGVKQGSVISPLFFTLYVDELVNRLQHSGFGCRIGNKYYGIVIYADDIFLLSPTAFGLQKMLNMCNSFAKERGLLFNAKKTQCIVFHQKHQVNYDNVQMFLNNDLLKWHTDVIHLGHNFNCCLNFSKDVNMKKGSFIQCVNELCSEFGFAHPACKMKLLQMYGSSFYGSNLWDFYCKEFISLGKTWNVGVRRIYNLPAHTHCRYLPHICKSHHVSHMLKCRFIKFMESNVKSSNDHVNFLARMCIGNSLSCTGRNVCEIISEYGLDHNLQRNMHVLKYNMDTQYEASLATSILSEEWKLVVILEIVDCVNEFYDNCLSDEQNNDILNYICTE